jgi:hypothetical protein
MTHGIQNVGVYFPFRACMSLCTNVSTQLRIVPSLLAAMCNACPKLLVNKHTNQQVNKLEV